MDGAAPRTSSSGPRHALQQRPRRLSLASSAGSASSARKALFADAPPPGSAPRVALGDVSLGALNSALSRLSAASASPPRGAGASTPRSAEPAETYAPRSVLRRRTPGQPPATGGGRISFGPGVVDRSPESESSLVKHSPRPPRWPAESLPVFPFIHY